MTFLLLMDSWSMHHYPDKLFDGAVIGTSLWADLWDMNDLLGDLRNFLRCYPCDLPCLTVRHLELLMDKWGLHSSLARHWYSHVSRQFDRCTHVDRLFDGAVRDAPQ